MKILKYTFSIPQLVVENGELIEMGNKEETHTFTLLFKGVDLYEKLSNKPLLTDLAKMSVNANESDMVKNLDIDLIRNLAKASYCKIDGDSFHQNMVTADEFSKTQAYTKVATDTEFMVALLNMAVDCCVSRSQSNTSQSTKK